MTQDSHGPAPAGTAASPREREALSALADGELPPSELADLVRRWGASADLREAWHCHQVIGDALRSDELGGQANEAGFLSSLRERLALEPVVLAPAAPVPGSTPAPAPAVALRRRRPVWATGAAVAAGFAAVAAVLVSLQLPGADRSEATLASSPAALAPVAGPAPAAAVPVDWVRSGPTSAAGVRPADFGPMIRDARLDAYLDAHRQLGSGAWPAAPVAVQKTERSPGAQR